MLAVLGEAKIADMVPAPGRTLLKVAEAPGGGKEESSQILPLGGLPQKPRTKARSHAASAGATRVIRKKKI
jgi:hypothetical protein